MNACTDTHSRRIAMLLANLGGGGAERVAIILSHRFVQLGHHVDFVLMQADGELLTLVPESSRVIDLGARRIRNSVLPLVRYLKAARPDVVLASMWPVTCVAVIADRCAGRRSGVVVSDHSILSASRQASGWARRLVMRMSIASTYRFARARIAVSQGVAEDVAGLGQLYRFLPAVIGNPVSTVALSGQPVARDVWAAARGKRILSVGALKAVKDHTTLLHAFALVRKRIEATLVILGEGKLRPELERLVDELELRDSVQMPGFELDPSPWYDDADLFVLSSRNEGFGNVIVEALQHGTPVVSTDCRSGPREILDDGRYGRLVPVGDAEAIAAAICEVLGERTDRNLLRSRAADFSAEKIAKRYLQVMFPDDDRLAARDAIR